MDKAISEFRKSYGDQRVKTEEPMVLHSVLKVGGPAACYIEVDSTQDLMKAVKLAIEHELRFCIIGSGSKSLFPDSGFSGLVIKNNTRKFDILSRKGKIRNNQIDVDRAYIYADSGALINQVVRFSIDQGYSGLECMLGLTGTIGGKLFVTSEADGEENCLDQHLYQIQAMTNDGKIIEAMQSDLVFKNRSGRVQRGNFVVLSVIFELFPGNSKTIWEKGTQIIGKRQDERPESPLSFRAFSDISVSEAMSIPTPDYTRSAGYLIENAGLLGYRVGDAAVAERYPNYIVNGGNATCDDMIKLIKDIQNEVKKKFGVRLNEAVHIVE